MTKPVMSNSVVHLIDDDESVRQSLSFMLISADFAVRTHCSATAFVRNVDSVQPGCIVSDMRMPDMDGIELIQCLKRLGCNLPVVMLTGHADVSSAVQAMKAGAIDFIEKPAEAGVMIAAVRLAIERHDLTLREKSVAEQAKERIDALSPRERQVMAGLLGGHPNKAIATKLNLSPRTVEVHRANVMAKLGVHSLPDLVRLVLSSGARPAA